VIQTMLVAHKSSITLPKIVTGDLGEFFLNNMDINIEPRALIAFFNLEFDNNGLHSQIC